MELAHEQAPCKPHDGFFAIVHGFFSPDSDKLFGGNIGVVDPNFVISAELLCKLDSRCRWMALAEGRDALETANTKPIAERACQSPDHAWPSPGTLVMLPAVIAHTSERGPRRARAPS
jgi:hypothetical protein